MKPSAAFLEDMAQFLDAPVQLVSPLLIDPIAVEIGRGRVGVIGQLVVARELDECESLVNVPPPGP